MFRHESAPKQHLDSTLHKDNNEILVNSDVRLFFRIRFSESVTDEPTSMRQIKFRITFAVFAERWQRATYTEMLTTSMFSTLQSQAIIVNFNS